MAKKNDVCRCIARVYRWGALRPHRCANPVWKDGYCKTHHMKIPALNLLPKKENTVRYKPELKWYGEEDSDDSAMEDVT